MRHRVDIEQRQPTRDAFAGETDSWVSVATNIAANIDPLSGRELYSAQQSHSEATVRIRIRYRAGVEAAQRVIFREQPYSILYVINTNMRNEELQLMCSIGVNEG